MIKNCKRQKFKSVFLSLIVILLSLKILLPFVNAKINSNQLIKNKTYSQRYFDRSGELLRVTLAGDERYRIFAETKNIDAKLIQGFLNKEDQYFFWHVGFNPISLARAFQKTYIHQSSRQGGSTITMQVARLLYPEPTRSISGKLRQLLQATKLEFLYSKNEILNAYLNWAPFGSNLEGVESACYFYFNKTCKKLTAKEIQFLVDIPQNPQKYVHMALDKKNKVFKAPHFIEVLMQKEPESKDVKTTLDYHLQIQIEQVASHYFESIKSTGIKNYSVVVIDTQTNEVLTYIGSADYFNSRIKGQIDANRSLKPPGSLLKPFIYSLALQQGIIHEKSLLKDTKMSFGGVNPENFDEQFLGPLASDQALILSRNLPAAELSTKLNSPTLYEFLNGKSSLRFKDEKYYGLSLPLGGVEFSMLDLMKLYASLAHQGKYYDLNMTLDHPKTLFEQILKPEAAYIVLQILKKNPRTESATLQELTNYSIPVAWKTGTSKSFKDAWTMGLMGNYLVGVWFGDNDREMNPAQVGRNVAAPLFFHIYDLIRNSAKYTKNQEDPLWNSKLGLNVKSIDICSVSKKIKTDHCQHKTEKSLFIPGITSIETCQIHKKVFIDPISKEISCDPNQYKNAKSEIIEVWPDDLLEVYKQAGLKKWTLSEKKFSCQKIITGQQNLLITSPQENIEYLIQTQKNKIKPSKIQLRAISESDSQYLDWFVDQNYVGRSYKNGPLFYETDRPGRYSVSVVDNLGRSQSSQFSVKVISQ